MRNYNAMIVFFKSPLRCDFFPLLISWRFFPIEKLLYIFLFIFFTFLMILLFLCCLLFFQFFFDVLTFVFSLGVI